MCIISGPVNSVKSTKIFVAPSLSFERQLTVYRNEVATEAQNLMILPVPHPETVQFELDVMKYKNLFKDVEKSFHTFYYESLCMSDTRSGVFPTSLKVVNVGSYKASVADSVDDLTRLDPSVFAVLNPELIAMLREMYGKEMGFVCCILKKGGNKYQPIAYSHKRAEGSTLFVPTKHYHVEDTSSMEHSFANSRFHSNKWADDWDHEIYSICTTADSAHKQSREQRVPKDYNELKWDQFPSDFRWKSGQRLHAWCVSGEFPNVDLEFTLNPV
jgi:hypothetical protein